MLMSGYNKYDNASDEVVLLSYRLRGDEDALQTLWDRSYEHLIPYLNLLMGKTTNLPKKYECLYMIQNLTTKYSKKVMADEAPLVLSNIVRKACGRWSEEDAAQELKCLFIELVLDFKVEKTEWHRWLWRETGSWTYGGLFKGRVANVLKSLLRSKDVVEERWEAEPPEESWSDEDLPPEWISQPNHGPYSKWFSKIPLSHRYALYKRYIEEAPMEEIIGEAGITKSYWKTIKKRARGSLRLGSEGVALDSFTEYLLEKEYFEY